MQRKKSQGKQASSPSCADLSITYISQCDLTRPRCLRCSKLGTVCPGYREEQDLLFNNKHKETFSAIGRKQRRRSGREAVGQDSSSAELSFSDPSLSLPPVRDEMSLPNHQGKTVVRVKEWHFLIT